MMNEPRQNLSIQGLSFIAGGHYNEVSISGLASAKGAISAGRLRIDGFGRFRKRAEIGICTISGIGAFRSGFAVDKLEVNGVSTIRGNLRARELTCEGILRTSGDLACEKLSATGSWRCRGDVDACDVHFEGAIRVGGVLSADSITLLPDVAGQLRDVLADRITIHPSSFNRKSLWKTVSRILGIRPVIHARLIEGENIELDAVHVERVCGKRVRIGPSCSAGTIEYSESLDVHPNAIVRNTLKVSD
jgi:cytoskeletal protein CcmA (bactofilin family)